MLCQNFCTFVGRHVAGSGASPLLWGGGGGGGSQSLSDATEGLFGRPQSDFMGGNIQSEKR